MSQLREDEWPAEGEPTTTNRQQPPGTAREAEDSPTPRHSHITGDGIDTQDTEPIQPAPDAPEDPRRRAP